MFKVNFTADFGVQIGRDAVAVHLWNTAIPELSPRMVYAALSRTDLSVKDGRTYP